MTYRKILGVALLVLSQVVFAQCFYNSPVNYGNFCTVYLNTVSLNELNNVGNGCLGYVSDYSATAGMKPKIYRGSSDTLFLQTIYGGYNQNVAIFIDWNGNNVYDSGEYYNFGLLYGYNTFPQPYPFAVPENAVLGDVRMRIRTVYYDQTVTESDLCTNGFTFGETEDYTLTIADKNMTVGYTTMQPTDIEYGQKGGLDNQVLRIEVLASGLLNPLHLDSLYFHLPDYVDKNNVTAAKIYKTNTDTFNTLSHIVTVNNPSSSFAITGINQVLSGGMNYYWLALDISPGAGIGDTIDAVSDSVFISGQLLLPFQNDPYGDINVDYCRVKSNAVCDYYLTQLSIGTNAKNLSCLNGYFKDSDYYDFNVGATYFATVKTNDDCQVGFMLDLNADGDFDDVNEFRKINVVGNTPTGFDVTIPSSTISGRIRMRVFVRTSISGPSDACTASGIYDADWVVNDASPMFVYDVQVRQYEKKLVTNGERDAVIVQLEVETHGASTPLALSNVYFNKAATTSLSHVSKATLWYSKGYSEFNKDSAEVVGTISSITEPLLFSLNKSLYAGLNYFWVSYDIGINALEGDKLDVDIDSVLFSDNTVLALNGNPSGYQQVSDTMWMKNAYRNVCRTIFYDDGGPAGNYTPTSKVLTLYTKAKRYYEITFSEFDLAASGSEDYIAIYTGSTPIPGNLLVTYSKSSPPSGTFTSPDSIITIEFSSSNATTAKGFVMDVSCKFNCNAYPPSLSYLFETPTCEGGLQKMKTQLTGNYLFPITYTFSGNGFFEFDSVKVVSAPIPDTSFYLLGQSISGQSYFLSMVDSNECYIDGNVYPSASNTLNLTASTTVTASCPYDSTGSISIAPVAGTVYSWTNPIASTALNLSGISPGLYQLHMVNINGCKDTSIIVPANPGQISTPSQIDGPDILDFNPGTQVYDLPKLPGGGIEQDGGWRTTPVIGLQSYVYYVSIKPASAGTVSIDTTSLEVAWDEHFEGEAKLYLQFEHIATGCRSTKSIPLLVKIKPEVIKPEEAEAPEAFSPNGDGKNDFFEFKNLDKSSNKLFVYNREGATVYEMVNYQNDWDGTLNGDKKTHLADGTYFYVLKNENLEDKFKGFVEIRR